MFIKKAIAAAMVLGAAGFASQAMAETATATFQVRMTILKSCSVTAGTSSDINLGSVSSTATGVSGSSAITVNCSKNTPYYIGLAPSNNNTAGAGTMARTGTPADTVAYQLRSLSATGPVWGNTATSTDVGNGVSGTGNGGAQSHTVFASVANANSTPGNYLDTVTVTVNY